MIGRKGWIYIKLWILISAWVFNEIISLLTKWNILWPQEISSKAQINIRIAKVINIIRFMPDSYLLEYFLNWINNSNDDENKRKNAEDSTKKSSFWRK